MYTLRPRTHSSRHIYEEELPAPHHAFEGHAIDEEVNHVPHQVHRVVLHVKKTVADDAVVLAVLDVRAPDVAVPNHPFVGNDLLQTVHRDVHQNERVRNVPVSSQERASRLRALCFRAPSSCRP